VSRRAEVALLVAASALPRLLVLFARRGEILESFTEKSDDVARVFVATGTFGFVPGQPSAYTQPLYAFFLVPLYAIDRHWLVVGLAQTAVAAITALVVYTIGSRCLSRRAGLAAGLIATLSPYLIWHDVHVNREVLDGLAAALVVLTALWLGERPTAARGIVAGLACGGAVLGNARLVLLPLIVAGFALWQARRAALVPAVLVLAGTVLAIVPWVVRNEVKVGCAAITTDARALWKANNLATFDILANGGWIDDVPNIPGTPITPQDAGALYASTGQVVDLDECEQMRFYQNRVEEFWREHPGEKARLAAQATWMLWDPRVSPRSERSPGAGTWLDVARSWFVPLYVVPLVALAIAGARRLPRPLLVLVVALLVYLTLAAMLFAGATRYRVPFDFLLALAAAPAVIAILDRLRERRR
jgi:hypothetical protein